MLAGQRVDSVRARALQGQGPAAEGVKGEISWSGPGRNVRYFWPQLGCTEARRLPDSERWLPSLDSASSVNIRRGKPNVPA